MSGILHHDESGLSVLIHTMVFPPLMLRLYLHVQDNQQLIQEKKTGYPIPGDEDFQQYGPKKANRRKAKKKVRIYTLACIYLSSYDVLMIGLSGCQYKCMCTCVCSSVAWCV